MNISSGRFRRRIVAPVRSLSEAQLQAFYHLPPPSRIYRIVKEL